MEANIRFRKFTERKVVPTPILTESVVEPEFKDACSIDNILKYYIKSGDWNLLGLVPRKSEADFKDVDTNLDAFESALAYRKATEDIREIEGAFNNLSAEERAKYDNDPLKWCEYQQTEVIPKLRAEQARQQAEQQALYDLEVQTAAKAKFDERNT